MRQGALAGLPRGFQTSLRTATLLSVAVFYLSGCVQGPEFHESETLNTLLNQYAEQSQAERRRQASEEREAIRNLVIRPASSGTGHVVSVDLVQASLPKVVTKILRRSGVSYNVSGITLTGRVTARFNGLPLLPALNQLLSHQGLSAYEDGDVIRIRYGAPIESQGPSSAKPDQSAPKSKEAPSKDSAAKTAVGNGRVYEEVSLRHVKMEDALTMLKAVFPNQKEGIQFGTLPERNAVYLAGPAADVSSARAVLHRADREVPHVLIEALVVAFTTEDVITLQNSITSAAMDQFSGMSFLPGTSGGNISFSYLQGTNNLHSLTELIELFVSTTKARVLSRPYMTARSRETAKIEIVQEAFIVVQKNEDGATISTNDSIAAGVTLQVVPVVQAGNTIRLQINIEDSDFITGPVDSLIAKRRNSAQTAMNVESGQTIVIGGLNHTRTGTGNSGLPWLRNVPGLNLFTAKQEGLDEQQEVVVYLTPKIWMPGMKAPVARARGLRANSDESTRYERTPLENLGLRGRDMR